MKILITGISGFVGTHLTHLLLQQGHTPVGLDRTPKSHSNVHIIQADILDSDHLTHILHEQRPDAIIHLAAQASPSLSFQQPRLTFEINLLGTLGIFESIRNLNTQDSTYNPKILVTGSVDEYGIVPPLQLPITESTPFHPTNPYAISKIASFHLAQQYADSYGLNIIYVSPFNQIGPGQAPGFFVPDMCIQIARIESGHQQPPLLTGNLTAKRDIVDVRDVVAAYSLLLHTGQSGQRYNICSGKSVSMKEILDQLLQFSSHQILQQDDPTRQRPSDIPDRYGSYDKLHQATGWQPQIPLAQSLLDTLNWYRQYHQQFPAN